MGLLKKAIKKQANWRIILHGNYLGKMVKKVKKLKWDLVDLSDVVEETKYSELVLI